MKTIEELKAFCNEYLKTKLVENNGDVSETDDWVQWGGYDLNLFGSYWSVLLNDNTKALTVDAYPDGWTDELPDALHTFNIQ